MLMNLLLLLLAIVVSLLPSCWSLCDISDARLSAHLGTSKKLNPNNQKVVYLAKRASEKADVLKPFVIEAYMSKVIFNKLFAKFQRHFGHRCKKIQNNKNVKKLKRAINRNVRKC